MIGKIVKTWLFYLITPLVLALAIGGIWVATAATLEGLRVGRATDLFISAVSHAREAGLSSNMDAENGKKILFERFRSFDNLKVVAVPTDQRGGRENVLVGPWGKSVRLYFYPEARALRFETEVPGVACRKILSFYADDAVSLGLLRVDVRDDLPSALWRFVYEQRQKNSTGGIDAKAIDAGCGSSSSVVMSLTFGL